MIIAGQHFMVLGLGATGLASARYLVAQGAKVTVWDHQPHPANAEKLAQELPQVPLYTGQFHDNNVRGIDHMLVSPGVPLSIPAIASFRAKGGSVLGDITLFSRIAAQQPLGKIIAVTGSNGKSTVTELVGHLCRHIGCDTVVAGNIGLPVLDALLVYQCKGIMPDYWVLELSSFQLDTVDVLNATSAVVLNISEDHLDRYRDLLSYATSKSTVFNGKGIQVINLDDPFCCAMMRGGRAIKTFSLTPTNADYGLSAAGDLTVDGMPILHRSQLPLPGLHNVANLLAAMALCESAGLERTQLLQGIASFRGLPHRTEWVDAFDGITYINDSKGTNVAATQAALFSVEKPVVLIAGGLGKQQDFSLLRGPLQQVGRAVVLMGQDASQIHLALSGLDLPLKNCGTLEEAVRTAAGLAQPGDVVLLSPACASLDMFKNYAHRGDVFRDAVQALKKERGLC